MKSNLAFRAWFYFRQGWSTYFAFIFAAINTLTVTYYLAIEKIPIFVIKPAGPDVEENIASNPYFIKKLILDFELPFFQEYFR